MEERELDRDERDEPTPDEIRGETVEDSREPELDEYNEEKGRFGPSWNEVEPEPVRDFPQCSEEGCEKYQVEGGGGKCGDHLPFLSWAPEVIADNSGKWCGNATRFATEAEATLAVEDLQSRWFLVRQVRVVPSTDPVNYRWTNKGSVRVVEGEVVR